MSEIKAMKWENEKFIQEVNVRGQITSVYVHIQQLSINELVAVAVTGLCKEF